MKKVIFILLLVCLNVSAVTWQEELESWKKDRVERLKKPHGWLSLIGMEWLHEGNNSIGSNETNNIVLPHGPSQVGVFTLKDSEITFTPAKDVQIQANNFTVTKTINVAMDSSGKPTVFALDTFKFYLIERGKPALRIKDSQAQTRKDFTQIDYYPTTDKFRIEGEFVAYNPPKEIEIINVLGLLNKEQSIGFVKFSVDDKEYQLDALDAGDEMFIIFADRTSGRTTYGPGRFLDVPKPKNNSNQVIIDFNKAYNPPCAFNEYSTCPLPPHQNRIRVFIEAGEKIYNH
jgi:uncharacterized protein (DUF1684 family)